jgi:hypothetical protein
MATALFINRTDLVRNSIIDGNVDLNKFIQFIKIAQEIDIRNLTGTDLYNRISTDIENGTLTGDYLTLVQDYIQPMLIWFAQVNYIPFAAYQIKQGGIYKHTSETAETVNKNEVDYLVGKAREYANYYSTRFVDYMCFNQSLFPEYTSNTNDDISPDRDTTFNGWVL